MHGGANLLVLEYLHDVEPDRAAAYHRSIAVRATEVANLFDILHRVHSYARRELPWCGPVDNNPTNVMQKADGRWQPRPD